MSIKEKLFYVGNRAFVAMGKGCFKNHITCFVNITYVAVIMNVCLTLCCKEQTRLIFNKPLHYNTKKMLLFRGSRS